MKTLRIERNALGRNITQAGTFLCLVNGKKTKYTVQTEAVSRGGTSPQICSSVFPSSPYNNAIETLIQGLLLIPTSPSTEITRVEMMALRNGDTRKQFYFKNLSYLT